MSKKKKSDLRQQKSGGQEKVVDYYDLHKEAVEDLATADESNSPVVSEEEIEKYRGKKRFQIPAAVKVIFVKWWFAGAVCFFFYMGLGNYIGDFLDQMFVFAFALGVVTDLMTNNVIRFMEPTEGEFSKFMMFPKKKYVNLFLNIIHGFVVMILTYMVYAVINGIGVAVTGNSDMPVLAVGPVIFGLVSVGMDELLIGIKHLGIAMVRDAKKAAVAAGKK